MIGYIFETECLKNGKKFIGKRLSTVFDGRYIGDNEALQKDALAYGPEYFTVKMLMPYETVKGLDAALESWNAKTAGDPMYYSDNAVQEAPKKSRKKKAEEE